jgi:hypothetical protein
MKIIGIHGPSRSGKDTVCQILMEEYPLIEFEKQGFADALKISAARSLGLDGSDTELVAKMDDLKEEGQIHTPWGKVSGRELLQYYGTEGHRNMFGNNFWIDQVIPDPMVSRKRFTGPHRTCDVLLVPDVRYQNEIGRVIDAGGELWKVRRDVKGHNTGHASEGQLVAHWDLIVDNNGSLEELRFVVKNAFRRVANEIMTNRVKRAVGA